MYGGILILKFRKALDMIFIFLLLAALAVSVLASEDKFTQDRYNLSHKDAKIRGEAAWALGKSGDSRAVGPLVLVLRDGDRNVREWAGLALVKIGKPAVEEMIIALESKDDLVRWQAAATLGLINDTRAVLPLISALGSMSSETRYWAAVSLGLLNDSQAKEELLIALGDENQSVRAASGWALRSIEGAAATDLLIQILQDSNSLRRLGATEALAKTDDKKAVGPLIQALQDGDNVVRAEAARALGEINDSSAVDPLVGILGDNDNVVRSQAMDALAAMGRPASQALIIVLESGSELMRQGAAEVLGEIKEERAIEPLIVAFQSKDMREFAVQALVNINRSRAVEPFIQLLQDHNQTSDIRADAAWALGEVGDAKANEALLQAMSAEEDNDVRINAAKALKKVKASA